MRGCAQALPYGLDSTFDGIAFLHLLTIQLNLPSRIANSNTIERVFYDHRLLEASFVLQGSILWL